MLNHKAEQTVFFSYAFEFGFARVSDNLEIRKAPISFVGFLCIWVFIYILFYTRITSTSIICMPITFRMRSNYLI